MRILYIVSNPPSLVRTRPYNLIQCLRAAGHTVTVATLWGDDKEQAEIAQLRQQGMTVLAARLSKPQIVANLLSAAMMGLPLQARYAYSPALAQQITAALGQPGQASYDVVHIEHLRGAAYAGAVARAQRLPVVWDSVDCISYLFEQTIQHGPSRRSRLLARVELARTRRREGQLLDCFDHVVVTSPLDATMLRQLRRHDDPRGDAAAPLSVLPNGVALDYFTPGTGTREPVTILYTGKMSYHANASAAFHLIRVIMPQVWAACPEARLVIAGKDPTTELLALARDNRQIEVTGTVPDLRPYLRSATLAVSPLLYGAGIQNKVLEALACGTAVIASPQAVAALSTVAGQHLMVAQNDQSFAETILYLLAHPSLCAQLGAAGRQYVEQNHDWVRVAACLAQLYRGLV
jgi:polysaccharide biosynthesis protein PslH